VSYDNYTSMTSLVFWLYVNCDSAVPDILVQRRFEAITDNMCTRDRHRGGNDEMKFDEDDPAGTSQLACFIAGKFNPQT